MLFSKVFFPRADKTLLRCFLGCGSYARASGRDLARARQCMDLMVAPYPYGDEHSYSCARAPIVSFLAQYTYGKQHSISVQTEAYYSYSIHHITMAARVSFSTRVHTFLSQTPSVVDDSLIRSKWWSSGYFGPGSWRHLSILHLFVRPIHSGEGHRSVRFRTEHAWTILGRGDCCMSLILQRRT